MTDDTQLTEKDARDIEMLAGVGEEGGPSFHTVLEVWRETLRPAAKLKDSEKITPQWAVKLVSTYPGVNFADIVRVHDLYYDYILELSALLDEEIATDDECLNHTTPEEDVEHNSQHYKNLLFAWNGRIVEWENAWECTDPDAAARLCAISEVYNMFFAEARGITAYLDNIKFEFTDADKNELGEHLNEMKARASE